MLFNRVGKKINLQLKYIKKTFMTIVQTLNSHSTSLMGIPIRRVLPQISRRMVGPFIFMDQAGPLNIPNHKARGIPEHPHAGLSTFSYLIEGATHHRDSAGHSAIVRSGDIALMTAGSGITHEEIPLIDPNKETHQLYLAQMWLALPDEAEEMPPTFEHHSAEKLPLVQLGGGSIRIAMGTILGKTAPTTCYASTFFSEIQLSKQSHLPLSADYEEQAIYILEGEAQIEDTKLSTHKLYLLSGVNSTIFSENGCRALYFGGDRFPTKRWIGGNFVASSREKLQEWMRRSQTSQWPRI